MSFQNDWKNSWSINSIVKIIIIINLEMSIDRNESIRVNNLRGNCKWNENNLSSWLVVSLREFHNILWLDTCWKPAGRPCCPKPLNYGSLPGAKLNTVSGFEDITNISNIDFNPPPPLFVLCFIHFLTDSISLPFIFFIYEI